LLENPVGHAPIRRSKRTTPSIYRRIGGQENPDLVGYPKKLVEK
jgi:hypothetical protein